MFHTVAFSANNTSVNVGTLVAPVVDPTMSINGNNLLVPDKINNLFCLAPFVTAGTAPTVAEIQSPSLREVFFPELAPVPVAATLDTNPFLVELMDAPIPLSVNEGLNYQDNATNSGSAGQHGVIAWLSDGPRTPIGKSRIYTIRATAAIQQAINVWTNGPLTFDQTLPVGNYDIVGMRAQAAGLLAARLVFVGASANARPGCPGSASIGTSDIYSFRMGRMGVWGTFNSVTPPSVDVIGGTAASQVIFLDLVQR